MGRALSLIGLPIEGASPASRRAALNRLSDEALAERLVMLALGLREADAKSIAGAASLPLGEAVASPFALRAVALGVEAGASAAHLELRARPDWPSSLGVAPEVADPDHGVWDRGVLKSGKYQGFLTDEALAIYDPSHVSKWGPHELMHRAASFFFRAGASRWEHYLGARLNELVPVVLWYGPEQAMRLDEREFDRAAAGRSPSAHVEDARWLVEDEPTLRRRAVLAAPILRSGVAHFERELAAIDEELARGRRVRAPHPFLDASSDATAYVVGHFDRLASEPVSLVLEGALPDALVSRDIGAYRDFIERLFDRLLFEPLALDLGLAASRRSARGLWDLLHRTAHLGEGVEHELEPLIDEARGAIERAHAGEPLALDAWRAKVSERLVEEDAELVLADGAHGVALAQLGEGLASIVPCTWALMGEDATELARSSALWDRAPLSLRAARWLEGQPALCDMARLEHAIASARSDDQIERLCAPATEASPEGLLLSSRAFERHRFEHDVVEVHAAFSAGEPIAPPRLSPGAWLIGAYLDEVAVLPCPDALAALWERLDEARDAAAIIEELDRTLGELPEGWPEDGEAWVRELLSAGALGRLTEGLSRQ